MPKLFRKKSRSRPIPEWAADNMVTEIVDQITEKQDRSFKEEGPSVHVEEGCSACLEQEPSSTGTSYRVILRCASDELALTHDNPRHHGGRSDA